MLCLLLCFYFNDTATTEIYTLSLHDALPIYGLIEYPRSIGGRCDQLNRSARQRYLGRHGLHRCGPHRSEEHTSELQSLRHLVCRLLLEKKKTNNTQTNINTSQLPQ